MTDHTTKPQNDNQAAEAMADIAAGDSGADWEVFHDPATGQMKFVRRGDITGRPQPGSVPITSIAASGFAGYLLMFTAPSPAIPTSREAARRIMNCPPTPGRGQDTSTRI